MTGPVWADERPLAVAALRHWLSLLPVLTPALCAAYLANVLALLLQNRDGWGSEAARAALLLGASWLGQAWAAAAVSRRERGLPVRSRLLLGDLREAATALWLAGLLRAMIVYAPAAAVALLGAARAGQVARPGVADPLPVAALLLLPLSLNLAALYAVAPAAALSERTGPRAVLARARLAGIRVFGPIWAAGLLLGVPIFLTSFLPGTPPRLFPNHALGSLLWVVLATAHGRAASAPSEAPQAA